MVLVLSFPFFSSLQLYCPIGIFSMENSGCFPRGKPAANSDINYRIFNVCTDNTAGKCTRGWGGGTDTVTEPALKVDSGRKIPGRTWESNLCQWRDGRTL